MQKNMVKLGGMQNKKMINCDILIREHRKSISITIGKNAEIIVKAPIYLAEQKINEFILKKEKWIDRHRKIVKENNDRFKDMVNLNKVLFFNELYNVCETSIKKSQMYNNILYIRNCDNFDKKNKEIKKWYITTADSILKQRLDYFSEILQLHYNKFKLTNAKGKWGSCSSKKEIQLNWRLIMLDSELQDYVIVHELCHILQMNHSSKFYKCVEAIIPDYKIRRKKIKNCNFVLQLFR